jgi:predicted Ser/Thr protein kinase
MLRIMATADIAAGTMLGGYRVERMLGHGGMGVVYLALQVSLDRPVALKVLAPELARDDAFRQRFLNESHLAASIDHPNVIPVHEAAEDAGRLYVTMRYVDGPDLGALLRAERRLEPARAARIIAQVGAALDAAHRAGLVHRDVKPGNVLVADAGETDHCYLTDFGLVKRSASTTGLTQTGTVMGTVSYIAPEQLRGDTVDGRADVYALGCVLFEVLTGRRPFERDTDVATMWAHLSEPPPAASDYVPSVPAALDGVVRRALAKDPDERWATAGELGRAALAATETAPIVEPDVEPTEPDVPLPPGPPPAARRRRPLLVAGGLAVAAAAVAGVLLLSGDDDPGSAPAPPLRATAEVPIGGTPVTAAALGDRVWVSIFERDGRLGLADFEARQGQRTRRYGEWLGVTAVSEDRLWVGDWGDQPEDGKGSVVEADLQSGRVIRRVETVDPYELAVAPGSLWVVDVGGRVQRIDRESGEIAGRISTPEPFDVAIVGGTAWVLDYTEKALLPFDLDTAQPAGRPIDVGAQPLDTAVHGEVIWVVSEQGQLVRADPATGRTTAVAVGPVDSARLIAAGDDALWIKDKRGVTRVDPADPTRQETLRLTGALEDIAASGTVAYVTRESSEEASSVVRIEHSD